MQQYADIYSLQNYSTCFGCHSTYCLFILVNPCILQYDLYRRLWVQFLILLMMGAVTPKTCIVVLQWINICILLHLLDFYSHKFVVYLYATFIKVKNIFKCVRKIIFGLFWPILLLYVLKRFWCQLPKDGEITAPKRVGTAWKNERTIYRIVHWHGVNIGYVRHFPTAVPDMNRSIYTTRQSSVERHDGSLWSCAGAAGAVCREREGRRWGCIPVGWYRTTAALILQFPSPHYICPTCIPVTI